MLPLVFIIPHARASGGEATTPELGTGAIGRAASSCHQDREDGIVPRPTPFLAVLALAVPLLFTGCSSYGSSSSSSTRDQVSCDEMLDALVEHDRSGSTTDVNDEYAWMSENCDETFEVLTEYVSMKISTESFGVKSCASHEEYISANAIRLLYEDGLCTDTGDVPAPEAPAVQQPGGGIAWNEAIDYAGTTQRVCGPLAGGGNDHDDVFLNLGLDYPDPNRFQIVIWDIGGLEAIDGGKTLCIEGLITLYNGVAQIEPYDPSVIEIYG
jgi:hypothetical protein